MLFSDEPATFIVMLRTGGTSSSKGRVCFPATRFDPGFLTFSGPLGSALGYLVGGPFYMGSLAVKSDGLRGF